MFDWIDDLIDAIADAISEAFEFLGTQISNTIWNTMLRWFYETIYEAVADFFTMMGNMGADIFALDWVQATIKLFTLFGWSLFIAGMVVAIFDVAIEYQHGRADIKTTSINILHGSMKNRSNICPESSVGTNQDSKGSSKMNATSAKNPIR